jgi:hypothetical protein
VHFLLVYQSFVSNNITQEVGRDREGGEGERWQGDRQEEEGSNGNGVTRRCGGRSQCWGQDRTYLWVSMILSVPG